MDNEFILYNKDDIIIDPNKKTIGIFAKDFGKSTNHHTRFSKTIVDELSKTHNIVFFSAASDVTVKTNLLLFNSNFSKNLLRKADNYIEYNYEKIKSSLLKQIKCIGDIEYIINFGGFALALPGQAFFSAKINQDLSNRWNEYFDYIGEDASIIELIKKQNNKITTNILKYVNPMAFSLKRNNFYYMILEILFKNGILKNRVINIIDDPIVFTPFLDELGIPNKTFYFANDFRGTRKFHKFGHAQIQHIITDAKTEHEHTLDFFTSDDPPLKKSFIFYGTVFQTVKTARKDVFDEFLRNLYVENSSIFISLKRNWTRLSSKATENDIKNIKAINEELYEAVINHPMYEIQDEFPITTKTLSKYKYSLVARCVSFSDSLNYRPVFYVIAGVLPFLDYKYDPCYVQIPKKLADKLIVKDHNDIYKKIEYFDKHDEERLELLSELRSLFEIDKWERSPDEMLKKEISKLFE